MAANDRVVTLVPYFKVNEGKLPEFRVLCQRFVDATRSETGCVHYAFSFSGDAVHCREGYDDADGVLAHLKNVGPILDEALKLAAITQLEVHGPADQLDQLRGPLGGLNPKWFTVELGFRR